MFCGPAWKCFVVCIISHKCSTNIFCLAVRLENISWRLLVTIIYTSCTSIIHLSESMFCFMGWPEISLQFLISGKPVWRSGLKVWFQVNKNLLFSDVIYTTIKIKIKMSWLTRKTKVLESCSTWHILGFWHGLACWSNSQTSDWVFVLFSSGLSMHLICGNH